MPLFLREEKDHANIVRVRPYKSAAKNLISAVGYIPFNNVAMKSRNHAAAINQNA
jgi:hypothetical protein